MTDDEQPEYGLVMPFVTTVSHGGPHEDAAYVAGWECGRLDAVLANSGPEWAAITFDQTVHTENLPQLDLVAMKHRFHLVRRDDDDLEQVEGWTHVRFERPAGA